MGLRIIAYPAFRDAAGGDGFAADCLVSQGVGLKSLRICSFLARRNSLKTSALPDCAIPRMETDALALCRAVADRY